MRELMSKGRYAHFEICRGSSFGYLSKLNCHKTQTDIRT